MPGDQIVVRGAREHNLKNIDVTIPRDQLVVITGLSGSGKSTLAFDTIFAEGQRRYVESLSVYARQFLGQLNKPDVDAIDGLSPAIAIDQKGNTRNPRSTVGTVTEIYDYLRLLFARIGHPHCPIDGRPLERQTTQQMVDAILALPDATRLLLLAPVTRDKKGEHQKVLDDARKSGFVRARIDGAVRDLDEEIKLEKYKPHTIEVVVDRLVIRHPAADDEGRKSKAQAASSSPSALRPAPATNHPDRIRVSDSVETALKLGNGMLVAQIVGEGAARDLTFSQQYACPVHGPISLGNLEPRDFSFNNPNGACPTCGGLGVIREIDPDLVLPDRALTLAEGAIVPWSRMSRAQRRYFDDVLESLAEHMRFSMQAPVRELPPDAIATILYGSNGDIMPLRYHMRGEERVVNGPFEGVIPSLRRRLEEATDEAERAEIDQYMTPRTCTTCNGARLRPEVLGVTIGSQNIAQVAALPVEQTLVWSETLLKDQRPTTNDQSASSGGDASSLALGPSPVAELTSRERMIATPILKEVRARLAFLADVGLGYLTLDRTAATLSGGESQRIRLATQIGSGLMGVLYILDEPSIGLHPRDHHRLLATIQRLRDLGNTVLIVEHDEDTIRAADWIIDIGPGAGEHGGELIASGPLAAIVAEPRSLTGQFLSGRRRIPVPRRRRAGNGKSLVVKGAREHNLKNIDVALPLGTLICVTGVSGSGKSTLVTDTLYPRLAQALYTTRARAGAHDSIYGIEHLDKVIDIDQSPIGRTPRSNPATYTKAFDPIRQLFAQVPEARARGYDASRFSFNVKGGRCEHCNGEGLMQIEMQFLPDIFVPCEVCGGARYNRETLDIRYRGKNIAEILDMTVEEALAFFERVPALREKLQTLMDVGLGYVRLGQSATTLSGGEAQRIKLATELARRATGRTLYILDEPTTGLHFADIERLLHVLQRLVDAGNTVLVIEHNLDVVKSADWIVDMGPEGGDAGGRVVAAGTPEQLAKVAESHTGAFLRNML
ncbi:MAG TPA: excinuclease ABC subunit UvrA [Kouleothrix sp.]|uniref:excinuclease ABC subunit UvrA n=1 Tax=Kouleothrix sp. TaxID=2779161 RepID=UPI002CFCEBBB|nr:excinuclease ABC subunit UvrA [Kouleothrix sp.]HRC74668.1 excinuclease ABC subunit UvrA [Kouleothrix sp.]